jgi:hypothetical protein
VATDCRRRIEEEIQTDHAFEIGAVQRSGAGIGHTDVVRSQSLWDSSRLLKKKKNLIACRGLGRVVGPLLAARGHCKPLSPTSSVPPRRSPGLFFAAGPVGPPVAPAIGSGARVREWTAAWVNRCLARVLVVPGRTSSGQMLHVCATGVVALLCSAPVRVGPNSISGDIGGRRP